MNHFPYQQLIDSAVCDVAAQIDSLQPRIHSMWQTLEEEALHGNLPFMTLPDDKTDLPEIERWAEHIGKHFSHLIVIGTGGSSLGAMTLTALRQPRFLPGGVTIHYLDNADPDTVTQLFLQLPLADCFFLTVSKSGNTVETVAQLLLTIQHLQENSLAVAPQCLALTMSGNNPLHKIAEHYRIPVINHHPKLGGRFSVLSAVGLLPAAVAGLSLYELRAGAAQVMASIRHNPAKSAPAIGACLQYALLQKGKNISVLMPYADRLEAFGRWYQQLWAESLGKHSKGSTPVKALGAVDQHSQLQLYLDGPKDKFITLLSVSPQGHGVKISSQLAQLAGMEYIGGQPIGNILAAQQQGTATTLQRNHVPLREILIPVLNESAMGALLQHYMMETVFMAGLLEVNAFDQPAVEESKHLARDWLASRV